LLAAFIISLPLPPIAVVFGCGGGRFASNSGAGSDGNNSRWRCATPDFSSNSCMPSRLMAVVAPTTMPSLTSVNRNLRGPPPPPLVPPRRWRFVQSDSNFDEAKLAASQ
jgi:hypothetical protein